MIINEIKSKSGGVFRIVQTDGVWHLINPDGKPVFKNKTRKIVAAKGCVLAGLVVTANTLNSTT